MPVQPREVAPYAPTKLPTIFTKINAPACLGCAYEKSAHGDDGWLGGVRLACPSFEESPYFCPICKRGVQDPRTAMECCLCVGCMHLIDSHRVTEKGDIVRKTGACREAGCGCPGVGCEVAA